MSSEAQQDFGGSIGTTWPPKYDEDNDRVKGFQTKHIENPSLLIDSIDRLESIADEKDAGRITCRFVVDNEVEEPDLSGDIEVEIPLDGQWEGNKMIYYGENYGERQSPQRDLERAEEIIQRAVEKNYSQRIESVENKGYNLRVNPNPTDELVEQMQEVYNQSYSNYPFDFKKDNIMDFFDNQIVIGEYEDQVVFSYVGEVAELPIETSEGIRDFTMAELSDAATLENHGGEGLFVAGGQLLLEQLSEEEVDLVYGESRASSYPVNIGSSRMGRNFEGTVEKHCEIGGRSDFEEKGPYENLNVWAITSEGLESIYG
ncbi:MAG: hypothetical protein ABEJ98_06100 [Candidatus Nanohaloarchaea archaeon]